jgi:hypothetical protein
VIIRIQLVRKKIVDSKEEGEARLHTDRERGKRKSTISTARQWTSEAKKNKKRQYIALNQRRT